MISDSELSDDFSLDTVGSHGDVKCKGRYKDYLVRFLQRYLNIKLFRYTYTLALFKASDIWDQT